MDSELLVCVTIRQEGNYAQLEKILSQNPVVTYNGLSCLTGVGDASRQGISEEGGRCRLRGDRKGIETAARRLVTPVTDMKRWTHNGPRTCPLFTDIHFRGGDRDDVLICC